MEKYKETAERKFFFFSHTSIKSILKEEKKYANDDVLIKEARKKGGGVTLRNDQKYRVWKKKRMDVLKRKTVKKNMSSLWGNSLM